MSACQETSGSRAHAAANTITDPKMCLFTVDLHAALGVPRALTVAFITFFGLSLPACAEPEWVDLVDMGAWKLANPDPWPDRPDLPACGDRAVTLEEGTVELDTNACGWITAEAPLLVQVTPDTPLAWFIFHDPLVADETAEATLGIQIGETAWTEALAIPSAAGFFEVEVNAVSTVRAGEPLRFHVHNHGSNTYNLGWIRAWQRP
jgi:hypothetical protein